ncbi:MAG: nuclear transport factor 2 family protein [Actinomycetota bacterium]
MSFSRHLDPAVQLLLDRAACHDLLIRYAAGVDRRDFDLVESCFSADVDASAWGFTDRDSLMGLIRGVAVFHTTMHMMGNQFIEVDGDHASMDTYAMLTHHMDGADGEPLEFNMSGNRYVEKLRREGKGWIVHQRGGDPVWSAVGVTRVSSDDPAVRWLLDRAEIHDAMMRYALAIDLRDYDRIRSCFAPTFEARYGQLGRFTDIDELIGFIKGVEHFESTTHFLGSQLIEVFGDRALTHTPAMITHREKKGEQLEEWMFGGSSYLDEFVRVEDRWKIARRGDQVDPVPSASAAVPKSEDPAVAWLLDRARIHDAVATAGMAIDRSDWELFSSCFAEAPSDLDALISQRERWHSTCHLLGNQQIEIAGDEAHVETYTYITHKQSPDVKASEWSKGARRFVDHFVRRDGRWVIAERRLLDNRVNGERG